MRSPPGGQASGNRGQGRFREFVSLFFSDRGSTAPGLWGPRGVGNLGDSHLPTGRLPMLNLISTLPGEGREALPWEGWRWERPGW